MDSTQELQVRKAIADKIATVAEAGIVVPTPLYCNDVPDFWATLDNTLDTKDEIESTQIAACWIAPKGFVDDLSSSQPDSPLVLWSYEIYLFRQYGLVRVDETNSPVLFDSQMLKLHNMFIKAVLDIKTLFQGNRTIAELDPAVFATRQTQSITQDQYIDNRAICKYVPGIVGFAVTLTETVKIKLVDC